MFQQELPVLLVDDDPDVLAVSKLAMKNFAVNGVPIKIYLATSLAEAIQVIDKKLNLRQMPFNLAVAFIDVVMESDVSGLELCDYIRNTLGNSWVQLFIRTGQPGVAPEREVIDRYDINGYFTKVEATEDKLYSLVKAGVRQHLYLVEGLSTADFLHGIISYGTTREAFSQFLNMGMQASGLQFPWALSFDGTTAISFQIDEQAFLDRARELDQREGVVLSPEGDKYVVDGNEVLIKIAGSETTAATYNYYVLFAPMPPAQLQLQHRFVKSMAALWKRAG